MNLGEANTLVEEIRELLASDHHKEKVAQLAKAYAGEYRGITAQLERRIEQCVCLTEHSNIEAALQNANKSPTILEMIQIIRVLEFDNADDWEEFCVVDKLPVARRFDKESLQFLIRLKEVGVFHSTSKEDCEKASEMLAGLGKIKLNYTEVKRMPTTDSDKLAMKKHEELMYGPHRPPLVDPPFWLIVCKTLLILTGIIYVLYKWLF